MAHSSIRGHQRAGAYSSVSEAEQSECSESNPSVLEEVDLEAVVEDRADTDVVEAVDLGPDLKREVSRRTVPRAP
jgi:hypothetical protein